VEKKRAIDRADPGSSHLAFELAPMQVAWPVDERALSVMQLVAVDWRELMNRGWCLPFFVERSESRGSSLTRRYQLLACSSRRVRRVMKGTRKAFVFSPSPVASSRPIDHAFTLLIL